MMIAKSITTMSPASIYLAQNGQNEGKRKVAVAGGLISIRTLK